MKRVIAGLLALALAFAPALAANKTPLASYPGQPNQPIKAGDVLQAPAPTTANASINLPPGTAPASPANGDCWTTTAGLYCRINGSTVGPMGAGGGGGAGIHGTPTAGNCASWYDATTLQDAGAACGSGGSVATPGTISDLLYWFETTNIKASAGAVLQNMQNLNPWYPGQFAAASPSGTGAGPSIDATTLAGYPVLSTGGTSASRYGWGTPSSNAALLHASTIFVVFKPNTVSVTQAFVGGTAGALEFRINSTGNLELLKASTASIGTSSSTVNTSNWYQANATYNDSTGAYAFRIGRAAAGSGTNVQAITVTTGGILWNNGSNPEDLNSKFVALIIYNRVLSGAEIVSVENYLNAKYGV